MKTAIAVLLAAGVFPLAMHALGETFYIGFGARVLIYILMAGVLFLAPAGIFGGSGRA